MNIVVEFSVVKPAKKSVNFSLEDIGVSFDEWKEMDEDEKRAIIIKAVDEMADQPYLIVDGFYEI